MLLLSNIAFEQVESHKVYHIKANDPEDFRCDIINRVKRNGLLKESLRTSEIITVFFVPTNVKIFSGYSQFDDNNEFLNLYKYLKKVSISKLIRFIIAPRARQYFSMLNFEAPLHENLEIVNVRYRLDDYVVLKDDFIDQEDLTFRDLQLNMTKKGLTKIVNILRRSVKKRRREEDLIEPAKKVKTEIPERLFTSAVKITPEQYERFKILVKTQINEFENYEFN